MIDSRLLLVSLVLASPLFGQGGDASSTQEVVWKKSRKLSFVDVERDSEGRAEALRTSILRFTPADEEEGGLECVDLIGVVHIGDAGYYKTMNELFKGYDVVLFEMANESDPRAAMKAMRQQGQGQGLLTLLQSMPGRLMGLSHQVDHIDYDVENFVHADTSLGDAMARQGDDLGSLIFKVIQDFQKMEEDPAAMNMDLQSFLGMSEDPLAFKRSFAEALGADPDGIPGLDSLNGILIDERNAVCMERFAEVKAAGHRRIGIFYGAAHMRDFSQRLIFDHGLMPEKIAWLRAWDMRPGKGPRPATPMQAMQGLMQDRQVQAALGQAFELVGRFFENLRPQPSSRPFGNMRPQPGSRPRVIEVRPTEPKETEHEGAELEEIERVLKELERVGEKGDIESIDRALEAIEGIQKSKNAPDSRPAIRIEKRTPDRAVVAPPVELPELELDVPDRAKKLAPSIPERTRVVPKLKLELPRNASGGKPTLRGTLIEAKPVPPVKLVEIKPVPPVKLVEIKPVPSVKPIEIKPAPPVKLPKAERVKPIKKLPTPRPAIKSKGGGGEL